MNPGFALRSDLYQSFSLNVAGRKRLGILKRPRGSTVTS